MNTRNFNKLTVTGGFSTPKSLIEDAVNALVERYGFSDGEARTFLQATEDPERTELKANDSVNATLSAGIIPVYNTLVLPSSYVNRDGREGLVAFNPVEERSVLALVEGAMKKSAALTWRGVVGPDKAAARMVNREMTGDLLAHLIAYARTIKAIGRFSTTEAQKTAEIAGISIARVDTELDWLFGPNQPQQWNGKTMVVADGHHDELLIRSGTFVQELPEELFDRLRE